MFILKWLGFGRRSSNPPPPPPLLDEPWRRINWIDKEGALQYMNTHKPYIKDRQLRILLHGPVGAGKSSFINSVESVLRDQMCIKALEDNTSGDSFTKKYATYKIQKGNPGTFYPFVFSDIMGLESQTGGVHVDDVILALKGHVKDGYEFNPVAKLAEDNQFYNRNPTANDKVHVLVCVIPFNTLPTMTDKVVQKIRNIREEASLLETTSSAQSDSCLLQQVYCCSLRCFLPLVLTRIPQVAILTKVDLACPELRKDLRNVYRSKYIKKKMEEFSGKVGIPMRCIFPVKNYHEETDLSDDIDSLILNAMRHIINFGEDFVNRKKYSA